MANIDWDNNIGRLVLVKFDDVDEFESRVLGHNRGGIYYVEIPPSIKELYPLYCRRLNSLESGCVLSPTVCGERRVKAARPNRIIEWRS